MKRIFTLFILVMSLTAIQAQEAAAPAEGQPANAEANANAKLPGYKRFYNHSGKSLSGHRERRLLYLLHHA